METFQNLECLGFRILGFWYVLGLRASGWRALGLEGSPSTPSSGKV